MNADAVSTMSSATTTRSLRIRTNRPASRAQRRPVVEEASGRRVVLALMVRHGVLFWEVGGRSTSQGQRHDGRLVGGLLSLGRPTLDLEESLTQLRRGPPVSDRRRTRRMTAFTVEVRGFGQHVRT